MSDAIQIHLNGRDREVATDLSVRDLILSLDLHPDLIVVERNRGILRREMYDDVPVEPGDVIELVHFVGGG
ncbi:MAG: sulfur carrier protein ThiS [Longimicrobiales bacterium]|nr:sulfur carrier protein ThiS [Longimicrobiales bacterium]